LELKDVHLVVSDQYGAQWRGTTKDKSGHVGQRGLKLMSRKLTPSLIPVYTEHQPV
jgi:hypothetical protein